MDGKARRGEARQGGSGRESPLRAVSRRREGKMNDSRKGHRKLLKATNQHHILCLKLLLLLASIQLTESLRFTSLQLPALVQLRTNFWLGCQYELEDWEQLYSVKWYKNNEEFYRQLQLGSEPQQQQQQQQQYFGQAGVNVLMSSSNATHVRLLNASLDTEALYACEISTQNLSTIRYEREIRLYALPHSSRPAIIGARAAYALNDRVDLICSSDFARPRPALAWFINGRRIADDGKWFQLELARRQPESGAGLLAAAASLRFRLSSQLLAHLGRPKALRLECRLRLAEVSEVVYNQLTLGPPPPPPQQLPGGRQKPEGLRKRRMAGGRLRLAKEAAASRVVQSRAPASQRDLWLALGRRRDCAAGDKEAPLWPDDPLVAEVPGSSLLLNCTTAGALEASLAAPAPDASQVAYCADPNPRRKMLISGRYQEQAPTNQRPPPAAGSGGRPGSLERQRQRGPAPAPTAAYLSLSPGQLDQLRAADSAESSTGPASDQQQQQQWLSAPPLLEWFINNQEAPRSSASYQPELPLVAPALGARGPSAPSIDYAEYFANFDARPIQQHLVLNLSSQPNSRLQLRCSSTQAQVLAADSSVLTIFVVEANAWTTTANRHKGPASGKALQTRQPGNSASQRFNLNLAILALLAVIFTS